MCIYRIHNNLRWTLIQGSVCFLDSKKALWDATLNKVIIVRDVNLVEGKVNENKNIVLMELDVGNVSTKLFRVPMIKKNVNKDMSTQVPSFRVLGHWRHNHDAEHVLGNYFWV